jgi:hypothetical protein
LTVSKTIPCWQLIVKSNPLAINALKTKEAGYEKQSKIIGILSRFDTGYNFFAECAGRAG